MLMKQTGQEDLQGSGGLSHQPVQDDEFAQLLMRVLPIPPP